MSTLYIRNSDGDFVEIPSLKGDKGEDGIYFIPSIDADGNLVFEASEPNENGNIEVISMGGIKGKDGTSVTHEWVGTKLKVASASGVSEADLKGEPGKDAPQESILYTPQTLTKDQQEQVRTNIDAASKDAVDRLNEEIANNKGLTSAQIDAINGLFLKVTFSEDASAEYAAFLEAFGIESASRYDASILMHKIITKTNDSIAAIHKEPHSYRMALYATIPNSKRLLCYDGTELVDSEYSPIPIPAGSAYVICKIPDDMKVGMAFLGEIVDSNHVTYLADTGWKNGPNVTLDVSAYNDGAHYWNANLGYGDNHTVPVDFDSSLVEIYFVDANGNRI